MDGSPKNVPNQIVRNAGLAACQTNVAAARPLCRHHDSVRERLHHGVTLWQADLDVVDADAWPTVSPPELKRADRFVQECDRRRWLCSRRLLRGVLSWATRTEPVTPVLEAEPQTKPRDVADYGLHYSLSHSGSKWLLALAPCEVGVDIEHLHVGLDLAFARRVLSIRELRTWLRRQSAGRDRMLLSAWTAKEAVVKAIGCGLALPLSSIELPRLGRRWQPLSSPVLGNSWWLRQLPCEPGSAAALCAQRCLSVQAHMMIERTRVIVAGEPAPVASAAFNDT